MNTGLFKTSILKNVPKIYKRNDVRMTLDYQDDFNFFSEVINKIEVKNFNTSDVLSFLDKNKSLIDINFYLENKWRNNQISKTKLILKEGK